MLNGRRTRGKTYLGRLQHLQSFVLDSKVAETKWQAQALYYLQYNLWYGKLAIYSSLFGRFLESVGQARCVTETCISLSPHKL